MSLEILKRIHTVAMVSTKGPHHLTHYSAWPLSESVPEIAQGVYHVPSLPSEEGIKDQHARGRSLAIDNTKPIRLIPLDEAHPHWEVTTKAKAWKSLHRHWLDTGAYRQRVASHGTLLFVSRNAARATQKIIADSVTPARRTSIRIGHATEEGHYVWRASRSGTMLYLGWTHRRCHESRGASWGSLRDHEGALVLDSKATAEALRAQIVRASAPAMRKAIRAGHSAEDGHHVWRTASDGRTVYIGWITEQGGEARS